MVVACSLERLIEWNPSFGCNFVNIAFFSYETVNWVKCLRIKQFMVCFPGIKWVTSVGQDNYVLVENYNKILKSDWLSPARFKHWWNSVRAMPVIGQCNRTVKGTVDTSCPCKFTECLMCARCCLAFRRVNCCFCYETYNRRLVSFANFVIVLINW